MGFYEYELPPVATISIDSEPVQINRASYIPHNSNKWWVLARTRGFLHWAFDNICHWHQDSPFAELSWYGEKSIVRLSEATAAVGQQYQPHLKRIW